MERPCKFEFDVGQNWKRQLQTLRRLALIRGVLRGKPIDVIDAEALDLRKMIAE
jgi:hypothetical protein